MEGGPHVDAVALVWEEGARLLPAGGGSSRPAEETKDD